MDAKSGSGAFGTFTWGVIAGLIAVVAAGGVYLSGILGGDTDDDEPATAEVTQPALETPSEIEDDAAPATQEAEIAEAPEAPTQESASDPETSDEQTTDVQPVVIAPVLDQIFVEPDGNALLSGSADPGAEIDVVLDGEAIHSFTVDETGQFAVFLLLPFADTARGLTLTARVGEQSIQSDDYLIAALPAPEEAPVATAEAAAPEETPVETAEAPEAEEVAPATPDADTEVASADVAQDTEQSLEQTEPEAEVEEPVQDQQVAILRSGQEGVELVQPPAAQTPPEQVALDTIGYSDVGDVELTGRVQQDSAVRLYLNNRLVDDLPPTEDGKWRSELEGIDPGVYTLRVDEVASDGTVVSRLETPFKREPVEALREAEVVDATETPAETPPIRSVTVQKGDTLWAISRERFGDGILYVKLFDANRDSIRDPDLIYPGQIFTIPE